MGMKKAIAMMLLLMYAFGLVACGTAPASEAPNAMIPMVMIDGEIYMSTGMESTISPRWAGYDGKITSTVKGSEKPTENDQSNFGTDFYYQLGGEGIVEICIDNQWWIFATEDAKERLLHPEQFEVVDRQPDLVVNYGQQSVNARHCLINWEFTMEDGMQSALMGDGPHPLMAKQSSPFITLDPETPMEVWLYWEIMPDLVEVNCWEETCWEELKSEPIESFRIMEGNEAGDSYLLRPKSGNYIYEIIATWQNAPNFGGTVRYSFHTET